MLEARHLEIVAAIADAGTVSGAALRLHLTQPAVSHALRDLEARLGVELFARRHRRMEPTAAGERLLETAASVLPELERAERALAEHGSGHRGIVRLATGCYTCYHWLPGLLSQFQRSHPDVVVRIEPDVTYSVGAAFRDGRLDLAIVPESVGSPRVVEEPLFEDELVAVVRPDHAWARRRYVTARDFARVDLILHVDPAQSDFVQRILRPAGVEPRRLLQLRLTEAVIEATRAGLGVTVLPHWVVAPELEAGRLAQVRLTRSGLRRQWYVAVPRDRRESPALSELVRLLHAGTETAVAGCAVAPDGAVAGVRRSTNKNRKAQN